MIIPSTGTKIEPYNLILNKAVLQICLTQPKEKEKSKEIKKFVKR